MFQLALGFPATQNYGFDNWCVAKARVVDFVDSVINNNGGVIEVLFLLTHH